MDRRQILALCAVVGGAGLLAYAIWAAPTDEERIEQQLHGLARVVSSPEPVGNVVFRAATLREGFDEFLAPGVSIQVAEFGGFPGDHRALALAVARVQSGFGRFEVELSEIEVDVVPGADPGRARARAVASLVREGSVLQEETREVAFELSEDSGAWRVTRVVAAGAQ
jgi:ribosomal protein S28E/S33